MTKKKTPAAKPPAPPAKPLPKALLAKKATWVPAWTVRHDGTIDRHEVSLGPDTVQVRAVGGTTPGERWPRAVYETRWGASPAEAIEKFQQKTQREVIDAQRELQVAQALFALALALQPPPEERE